MNNRVSILQVLPCFLLAAEEAFSKADDCVAAGAALEIRLHVLLFHSRQEERVREISLTPKSRKLKNAPQIVSCRIVTGRFLLTSRSGSDDIRGTGL